MVDVIEVKDKKQRKIFVEFPTKFYKDVPEYVPNTYDDDLSDWDPKKNPAFEYCDARCWLAYRNGEVVGRIGAICSHKANEKWGTRRLRFSQVDFIDDDEVVDALFSTVECWARELGLDEVQGPLGFTDMDREGMLIEGFDRRSCFFTYYNYPYYQKQLERIGYAKDVDWVENLVHIPAKDDTEFYERWARLSSHAQKRNHVHVHDAKTVLGYIPLLKKFFKLVNIAYEPLYGTVELSEKQIDKYASKFAPLINPKLSCFVMDENDEMVALGVGAPSMAEALKKHDGKLLPFGWIDILKSFSKNDTIDLLLIAVHPDYQGKGLNGIVMEKMLRGCRDMGIIYAETGPTLELNDKVLAQWKYFTVEQHKRRRCFIKKL